MSKHLEVLFNAGLVHRRREASAVIDSLLAPQALELCMLLGRRTVTRADEVSSVCMEQPRRAKPITTRRRGPA